MTAARQPVHQCLSGTPFLHKSMYSSYTHTQYTATPHDFTGEFKGFAYFWELCKPLSWLSLSLMVVLKPILKRSCLKWGPFEVALAAAAGARYPSQDALWESWPAVLAPFVWTCSRHDLGLHSTFHFSHQWQDDKPLHWI